MGLTRWEEKKKLGIKPGSPKPFEAGEEMMSDNLSELEEDD